MKAISRILCVVDSNNPDTPGLQRAAWLAEHTGAELDLFAVHYNEFIMGHPLLEPELLEKARGHVVENDLRKLESVAAGLRNKNLVVHTAAAWDHPLHQAIARRAHTIGADVVVKDVHRRRSRGLVSLSNDDWGLIRTCPGILWIVKRDEIPETVRLVAAVDPVHRHDKPAALDDAILSATSEIGGAIGAELHAFHAVDPRIAMSTAVRNEYIPASLPLADIEQEMRERHGQRLAQVLEPYGIGPDYAHLIDGLADEELPRLTAELNTTAVVMGAIARNPLKRLFIGSTAERVLNRLDCDMIVVKPDWFRTPVSGDHEMLRTSATNADTATAASCN